MSEQKLSKAQLQAIQRAALNRAKTLNPHSGAPALAASTKPFTAASPPKGAPIVGWKAIGEHIGERIKRQRVMAKSSETSPPADKTPREMEADRTAQAMVENLRRKTAGL